MNRKFCWEKFFDTKQPACGLPAKSHARPAKWVRSSNEDKEGFRCSAIPFRNNCLGDRWMRVVSTILRLASNPKIPDNTVIYGGHRFRHELADPNPTTPLND